MRCPKDQEIPRSMDEPPIDPDIRRRCETACVKLAEAVDELDALGFEAYATHAHLCLELVREYLAQPDL
jgi:hypothetical protein